MARAIVTYGRGWQTLALVRSLGRQGIEVHCGEEAPFAPAFFSRHCAGHFVYPSVAHRPEEFLDFLERKVIELKPANDEPYVLFPVHKETWLIAEHRERFEPHITVPLTSHANMMRTHDKGRLADLATELGILIPPTRQLTSLDDLYRAVPELRFPVFLKVRDGASGVGVEKCDTPEELSTSFRRFVEGYELEPADYPLVQEAVPGQDHCTGVLFDHGRCVAAMTYRNVRSFPRTTGAGALRETVSLPDAERAAIQLCSHLGWHGIAQLDFRATPGGPAYLIELNPRFFGGLPQAVAARVDFPHLLWRIACGETITEVPAPDLSVRTETPVTGVLSTLQAIAHDDEVRGRVDEVRSELSALGHGELREQRPSRLLATLRRALDPRWLVRYLGDQVRWHRGTVNDIVQPDDPMPVLGVLYPVALALKHGTLNMEILTSEKELEKIRLRRGFRFLMRRPQWRTLALTMGLFSVSVFLTHWEPSRTNVGWVLGWPRRAVEILFRAPGDLGTPLGALSYSASHAVELFGLYLLSVLILKEPRGPRPRTGAQPRPSA